MAKRVAEATLFPKKSEAAGAVFDSYRHAAWPEGPMRTRTFAALKEQVFFQQFGLNASRFVCPAV